MKEKKKSKNGIPLGRKKSVPTLKPSDGSEYEKIDAAGLAIRAQMIKDGVDVGPRPHMTADEWKNLPRCGSKRTGKDRFDEDGNQLYCKNAAGARTEHLGVGRCWLHGGRSKGISLTPEQREARRQKQIRTGEQETITYDALSPEEQELWANISTTSETQLEHDLRIITIRERRMLNRMNDLLEEGRMSKVEESNELKTGGINGTETKKTIKSTANLERMTALEEALTRVGKQKINIIEALDKARNGGVKSVNVTVGGKKGSPIVMANVDLSNVPSEELQRQLAMLEGLEDDD